MDQLGDSPSCVRGELAWGSLASEILALDQNAALKTFAPHIANTHGGNVEIVLTFPHNVGG